MSSYEKSVHATDDYNNLELEELKKNISKKDNANSNSSLENLINSCCQKARASGSWDFVMDFMEEDQVLLEFDEPKAILLKCQSSAKFCPLVLKKVTLLLSDTEICNAFIKKATKEQLKQALDRLKRMKGFSSDMAKIQKETEKKIRKAIRRKSLGF